MDSAIAAKGPKKIQQRQVDDILKVIIDCALPKGVMEKPAQKETFTRDNAVLPLSNPALLWPKTPNSSQTKQSSKILTKPLLQLPLNGGRLDSRLIKRLEEELPLRNEHPFLLQKRANAVLPPILTIRKVAHVKTGLALLLAAGTTLQQLQEFNSKLAQTFRAYQAEPNERWVKYLVRNIPQCIRTLDSLTDVSISVAKEAFKMATGIKPE